jgi:copper chaperone
MTVVQFDVPSIACGGCAELLTERIGQLAGVADVQVDVAAKRVMVTGDVDAASVSAAIVDAGHRAV